MKRVNLCLFDLHRYPIASVQGCLLKLITKHLSWATDGYRHSPTSHRGVGSHVTNLHTEGKKGPSENLEKGPLPPKQCRTMKQRVQPYWTSFLFCLLSPQGPAWIEIANFKRVDWSVIIVNDCSYRICRIVIPNQKGWVSWLHLIVELMKLREKDLALLQQEPVL